MSDEDYLTPVVESLVAGVILIASALVVTHVMNRYVDWRLRKMDREKLLNTIVPVP